MARRGRPRKAGAREANGRLQRNGTVAQLREAERAARLKETSVVLAQPHRRAAIDPAHPWAGTAVGRLLLPRLAAAPGETQMLFEAADAWRRMVRRLWRAKGVVDVNSALEHDPADTPGRPADLSDAEIDERSRALAARVERLRRFMVEASTPGFAALHDAALFDRDVTADAEGETVKALERLAVELRLLARAERAA